MLRAAAAAVLAIVGQGLIACGGAEEQARFVSLDPPAAVGAFAPDLWSDEDGLLMAWLEPRGEGSEAGHRVRFARLEGEGWSEPTTIVAGKDLFANWADFPSVARTEDGTLFAHALRKTSEETYAYSIFLHRSVDGGDTWEQAGKLNDDETDTEHGFVSWVREGDALRAFWLDGREMANDGPMALRTAALAADGTVTGTEVLDERVCECCSTDAAASSRGAFVVYRDRSDDEVRDVYRVGPSTTTLVAPAPVADDGWTIEGCPVNGPEVAAQGNQVFVVWFTAAGDRAQVRMARSSDGGMSFEDSVLIDDEQPLGRVDVVATEGGGAVLTWLGRRPEGAAIYLQSVNADGTLGEIETVAETSAARASGFPRLAAVGDSAFVAWVELAEETPSRVRLTRIRSTG